MRDPFKIGGLTGISFSGGRTSAYMLWRVLQSNGGLPDECLVTFANTGKEEEATLRFVRDCGSHWNVPITWLEFRDNEDGFAVVDFDSASRNGEPFAEVIRKRRYLPNPVTRFCTVELKIRVMHKFLRKSWGYDKKTNPIDWEQFVGIRADEPRRVAKIRARPSPEVVSETMCVPLADAGAGVEEVAAFWSAQPFNLELPTYKGRTLAGNCDLCFLKPANQVASLIAQKPSRAVWWAGMEKYAAENFVSNKMAGPGTGWSFRMDRPSYSSLAANVENQVDAFGHEEEGVACFCGD